MFTQVLAFGCSHVTGCELVPYKDQPITVYDQQCKPLAFAQQVSDHFGVPCKNMAMSGGSNDRSLRQFTAMALQEPPSLVLFGYTYTDRRELYWPDPGSWPSRDQDLFLQLGSQWSDTPQFDTPVNRWYIRDAWREYNNLPQIQCLVHSLALRAQHQVIDLQMAPQQPLRGSSVISWQAQGDYVTWMQALGLPRGPWGHGLALAHQRVAELIIDHLAINT